MRTIHAGGLVVAFLIALPCAMASPLLTYTFTGSATGSLNGAAFSDTVLTITAASDAGAVVDEGGGFYSLNLTPGSTVFSLAGVGSGTFTDPTYIWAYQGFFNGEVGFGTEGNGDVIQIHGSDFGSTVFETYDLMSPIGPVGHVTDPSVADWGPPFYPGGTATSLGPLVVTGYTDVTFTATAAPEPSAISLVGIGLGLLALGVTRKRSARS